MKRILFFLLCCFAISKSFGQVEYRNTNAGRLVNVEDLNGRSLIKKYDPDISGSPFINDNWTLAKITLKKGKEVGPLPVKLNLVSNEIYFLDSLGKEMIAVEGSIQKVYCLNYFSKDSIRYVFKNGYPAIEEQNENFYYQVYTEGKVELLVKRFKYIRTFKDDISGQIKKDFVDGAATLYVYSFDNLKVFQSKKDFILSLLIDKIPEVEAFINQNKISFKKTSDLIQLFNFYNRL